MEARASLCPTLLALLFLAAPARAGVVVVDQAAGPFTTIQAAIDAAQPGDTVLVRTGVYDKFTISAKSLSVLADGPLVFVTTPGTAGNAAIAVANLGAGQSVLVRGLRSYFGIAVQSCAGPVWFEEVETYGLSASCSAGGNAGAKVTSSARVTFVRCALRGELLGNTMALAQDSGPGLSASASTVQAIDCQIQGGDGRQQGFGSPALRGAAGLKLASASIVTLAGCTLQGGGGGLASGPLCTASHAQGGAGVEFVDAASVVRSQDSTAVGGARSLEPFCPGQSGPAGPAVVGSGAIVALPGVARHASAGAPVRAGATLAFELAGVAGEIPALLVSTLHDPQPLLNGSLLVGLPQDDVLVLPALPASGSASLAFPVPDVGAAVGGLTLYAQAVFLGAGAAVWLGAGTSVVLVGAGL